MTQFLRLIGADTPDSYGGCCYGTPFYPDFPQEQPSADGGGVTPVEGLVCFNCPEGTQRFSSEAGLKLTRVKAFCFTRFGRSASGSASPNGRNSNEDDMIQEEARGAASAWMGLPGYLISMNDGGVGKGCFIGPDDSTVAPAPPASSGSSLAMKLGPITLEEVPEPATAAASAGASGATTPSTSENWVGFLAALRHHYLRYRAMNLTIIRPAAPLYAGACDDGLAALPLGNHTILLRVRVRERAAAAAVYCYVIVEAPPARFDAALAKQRGVPPGPKYALLKRGIAVEAGEGGVGGSASGKTTKKRPRTASADPSLTPSEATVADSTNGEDVHHTSTIPPSVTPLSPPRIVHPHEVMQATPNSDVLHLTLVLDSNSLEGLKETLAYLLNPPSLESPGDSSRFYTIMNAIAPHLLTRAGRQHDRDQASTVLPEEETRPRRGVKVRHMVHLQPESYFRQWAATAGGGSTSSATSPDVDYAAYVRSLTCGLQYDPQTAHCTVLDGRGGLSLPAHSATLHHFTAALYSRYPAFPTAQVHHHHLHLLDPVLFPFPYHSDPKTGMANDSHDDKCGDVWLYDLKWRVLPDDDEETEKSKKAKKAKNEGVGTPSKAPNTVGDHTTRRLLWDDVSTRVRCPTLDSSAALLSAALHAHLLTSTTTNATTDGSGPGDIETAEGIGFVGTGSAIPSKYRNVSGCFLQLAIPSSSGSHEQARRKRRGIVVLDWGEGSCGQLSRLLYSYHQGSHPIASSPHNRFISFLEDLEIVFISHGHADHHLGLLALLELRHQYCYSGGRASSTAKEPLVIVCPIAVYLWLWEAWGSVSPYHEILKTECVFDVLHEISSSTSPSDRSSERNRPTPHLTRRLEEWNRRGSNGDGDHSSDWASQVFTVSHPANAHGLLLRLPPSAWPVGAAEAGASNPNEEDDRPTEEERRCFLFSGDTRPCASLLEAAKDFTEASGVSGVFLLLHESTFGPGLEAEAKVKAHSTISEALRVAAAVNARHVLLHHFSQRYPKVPEIQSRHDDSTRTDGSSSSEEKRVVNFAFDGMFVDFATRLRQRSAADRFLKLSLILMEEYDSWEVSTTVRMRQGGPAATSTVIKGDA